MSELYYYFHTFMSEILRLVSISDWHCNSDMTAALEEKDKE